MRCSNNRDSCCRHADAGPARKRFRTRFRAPGEIRFHERWVRGKRCGRAPNQTVWARRRILYSSSICLLSRTARTDGEKNKSEGRVLSRVQATAREASARSSSDPTPSCLSDATIVRGDPQRRTPRSSASPRVGPESWVSSPRTSRPIRRTSSWRRCVSARSRASVGFEPGVTTWRLLRSFALVRGSTRARSTFDASRLPRPVARPRRLDVDDAHVPDASPNPDRALPSPSDVTPVPTPPLPSAAPVRRRRATT